MLKKILFLNITFFISPFNSANFADPSAREREREKEKEDVCVCVCVSFWIRYSDTLSQDPGILPTSHAHHTRYHVGRSIAGRRSSIRSSFSSLSFFSLSFLRRKERQGPRGPKARTERERRRVRKDERE